jgi:predicted ABC-type ATPase
VEEENKASINIYYEKTPMYRTIHSDGVIGGLTPKNMVNLNFYSTRNAIPKAITHAISASGSLDKEGIRSADSKIGIIREIESSVYISKETAEEIFEFLKKVLDK